MKRSGRTWGLLSAALVSALALAGCTAGHASTGEVRVVASFYPLQFVAEQVGGDEVDVENLTPAGAEPHDLELTTRDVLVLEEADAVLTLSGFQPALDDALAEIRGPQVVDTVAEEDPHLGTADPEGAAENHAGHSHDEHAHAHDDGHGHLGTDPHFWLDPTRLAATADQVATALSAIDPANATTYAANAAQLQAELGELDAEFHDQLSSCDQHVIVVSHEAFGYLADRYGFEQVGVAGLDPESEPSPARMQQIAQVIRTEGVRTIFTETLLSPDVAEALADELDITVQRLDPLESLTDPGADYLSVMRSNLTALTSALECA
ncbi:metal ABC transporter substrate-binding protein [Ruania albidiflava]|uniref:metal ABC transporter substrate-binding protein n=1 Tax=Ruania albidiflava TaxID=366586 RepID=UPI0003B4394D|nr:metal ABC transporter substrate-binding protein [Ruania albidiflava]